MAKEMHDEGVAAIRSKDRPKDGGNVSDQVQNGCRESKNSEIPACQSCRKKKAKCSRQQPCAQCEQTNIECVHDDKKVRPGLRTGAVESLSQRVDKNIPSYFTISALESMFLGQGLLLQPLLERALSLQSPASASTGHADTSYNSESLVDQVENFKAVLSNTSTNSSLQIQLDGDLQSQHKAKRRRIDDPLSLSSTELRVANSENYDLKWTELPPNDLMYDLVEIYFANIHPWIPILHVRNFRQQMNDSMDRPRLKIIFHAIVSICIGSGRGPFAWLIIGSTTRTIEQLQLSVEDGGNSNFKEGAEFLIRRMAFLDAPKTWLESEERRRNVFLMDRFCSVATGWNKSLTDADVRRRLPAEGALWEAGREVQTPYFGVPDQSSSARVPSHVISTTPRSIGDPEVESIGGFAYYIEATESLSLVTTFFLQHAVNVSNVQEVQLWLMRFKELDLRLIQWKFFLPLKWREASVLNADGVMDPNPTLAHITHNTSVILLHQGIAYPSPRWRSCPIRLPSDSSASTCIMAASEVSTIVQNFLLHSTTLINPQFSFCIFISARVLHAHARYHNVPLSSDFSVLVSSLHEISRRFSGPHTTTSEDLASRSASRLTRAEISVSGTTSGPSLDIRQTAYSNPTAPGSPNAILEDFGKNRGNSSYADAAVATLNGWSETLTGIWATKIWLLQPDFMATNSRMLGNSCDHTQAAVNYFKYGLPDAAVANGALPFFSFANYTEEGSEKVLMQGQEAGRDQAHTLVDFSLLGVIGQQGYNQNMDFFATFDNQILNGAEYAAKYNTNNTAPYTPYTSWEGVLPVVANKSRFDVRPGFETIYSHYTEIKGLNVSWSKMYRDFVNKNLTANIEGGGGDYSPNSGGYDALGHGTLMYRLGKSG
ncbi:hypothetical protein BPAE_0184g00030 [Botrytis paeoniae]|uniref:Zn(2)-C6 fungal-type domain-containing protein n=1 Tax=Botrytis paeoniae TaxID=278948 RepID=A0A4Z1FKK1_9HELO|nr:hypothetical protein BPAE_0184g00030 [Botrytis paeoniae]